MTRISLSELLRSKRYKLLYYFYRKRRIRDSPGIKSELAKLLDYKSDGHFYSDWNYLLKDGFLIEKDGFIKITRKGISEFRLLDTLQIAMLFSLMFSTLQFYYLCIIVIGVPITIFSLLYLLLSSGIGLLATAILCFIVVRDYTPKLPLRKNSRF